MGSDTSPPVQAGIPPLPWWMYEKAAKEGAQQA